MISKALQRAQNLILLDFAELADEMGMDDVAEELRFHAQNPEKTD